MTSYDNSPRLQTGDAAVPRFWVCILLGLFMIMAGILALGDVVLVTVISTVILGFAAIATGVFEIIHALWTKGWGGFIWQVLLGVLYTTFGVVLVSEPVSGALILTYVLGLLLLMSGIVRICAGFSHWRAAGWIMLLSRAFEVLAGLVISDGLSDDRTLGHRVSPRRRPDLSRPGLADICVAIRNGLAGRETSSRGKLPMDILRAARSLPGGNDANDLFRCFDQR